MFCHGEDESKSEKESRRKKRLECGARGQLAQKKVHQRAQRRVSTFLCTGLSYDEPQWPADGAARHSRGWRRRGGGEKPTPDAAPRQVPSKQRGIQHFLAGGVHDDDGTRAEGGSGGGGKRQKRDPETRVVAYGGENITVYKGTHAAEDPRWVHTDVAKEPYSEIFCVAFVFQIFLHTLSCAFLATTVEYCLLVRIRAVCDLGSANHIFEHLPVSF